MKQNIFNTTLIEKNDINIIYINGYLDAHSAPNLENEIQNLLNNNKFKLIIDFSNLEYISSAGLGVFMTFIELIRENNGDMKFVNMKEKVKTVFDLLGFHILFEIYDNLDTTIENFSNSPNNI